jgi:hypothetical protein
MCSLQWAARSPLPLGEYATQMLPPQATLIGRDAADESPQVEAIDRWAGLRNMHLPRQR